MTNVDLSRVTQVDALLMQMAQLIVSLAEMEADLIPMLGQLSSYLIKNLAEVTFRRFLVDRCQEKFEKSLFQNDLGASECALKEKEKLKAITLFVGELHNQRQLGGMVVLGCIRVLLTVGGESHLEIMCELISKTVDFLDRGDQLASKIRDVMTSTEQLAENCPHMRCLLKKALDGWSLYFSKKTKKSAQMATQLRYPNNVHHPRPQYKPGSLQKRRSSIK